MPGAGCCANFKTFMDGRYTLGETEYYTQKLQEKCPGFLMEGEQVEMVFKWFSHKVYFTNKRIIKKRGKFAGGNLDIESIAYKAIGAYELCTPSGLLDSDSELMIYTTMEEFKCVKFEVKKTPEFDVTYLVKFLNESMLACSAPDAALSFGKVENNATVSDSFTTFFSSDAAQMPAAEAQQTFAAILHPMETVAFCFKRGRDVTILSNMRMLFIDYQRGLFSRYVYTSLLWQSVRAFSVESGSTFDNDAEFVLYTNLAGKGSFKQEMKKTVDILAIQKFIGDMVLGTEDVQKVTADMEAPAVTEKKKEGWFNTLTGNVGMLMNSQEAEDMFKSEGKKLLADSERVELAYKAKKDFFLFTTKRFIIVDHKSGVFGMNAKDEYISIPYKSITGFSVQSASGWLDKDSEMMLWTDIAMPEPIKKEEGDGENKKVTYVVAPGLSYKEFDFKKDQIDLLFLHRLLSARVCPKPTGKVEDAAPMDFQKVGSAQNAIDAMLSFATGDARPVDPKQIQEKLAQWFMPGEKVQLAFKAGRDLTLFTNLRFFYVDPQGLFGKKVEYRSFPYSAFCGFSVEAAAGSWDADVELRLFPKNFWESYICVELRKGKVDVIQIQRFLSEKILSGMADVDMAALVDTSGASQQMGQSFFDWLNGDNARALDPEAAQQMLQHLLMGNEKIQMAFRAGKDLFVISNKRVLLIDKEGSAFRYGRKTIEYKSLPWTACQGMRCESASGLFDADSEIFVFTSAPSGKYPQPATEEGGMFRSGEAKENAAENACCLEQDLRKGCAVSIFDIAKVMNGMIMTVGGGVKADSSIEKAQG